jgi:hypothetical protein
MALNDINFDKAAAFGTSGTRLHQVAASATLINAGEPVGKTLGNQYVIPLATNKPAVGTDYMAGIAESTSTNTASAAGTVQVWPLIPGVVYTIKPKVPATFFGSGTVPSQSTYNALVGSRVLIDLTAGSYTILAADSSTNGCVIENIDVVSNPGLVAFSIRQSVAYTI